MTEQDDRLQEHLEALEAGALLDRVLASAGDEDAALLRLASAVRGVAHPAAARRAFPVVEHGLDRADARDNGSLHGTEESMRYAKREGLMSRLTAAGLFVALIALLIGAALLIPRLSGDGDVAGVGEATGTPGAVVSAALTLPDGGKPGWLETDTAYPPERAAFSPDGSLLATAHKNGTAIIWDLATGERLHTFQGAVERSGEQGQALTQEIGAMTFSPDGSLLAAGRPYAPGVDVWDVATGDLVASLEGERGLADVAFSPDGSLLAAGIDSGQSPEPAGKTIVWDTGTWSVQQTLADAAPDIAFSPDGSTLATRSGVSFAVWTGQDAGPVVLWDVATGERRATVPVDGFIMQMALSPDGETLALNALLSNGEPATLLVDAETGETRHSLSAPQPGLDSLAFSPDGSLLVVGYQPNRLVGWDTATGAQLFELAGALGADWLRYPTFSPDGSLLAANSSDGRVLLWNVGALSAGAPGAVATEAVPPDSAMTAPQPYTNTEYGFSFDVPGGWAVEELPGAVKLRNEVDELQLYIGYRRPGEGWGELWTGMPAGEFEDVGEVPFLSGSLTKSLLVYEGNVKVVTYGGPRGTFDAPVVDGLQVVARLDDVGPYIGSDSYDQVDVTEAAQALAEAILASFRLNAPSSSTPTPAARGVTPPAGALTALVIGDPTVLRAGPGLQYDTLAHMMPGTELVVLGKHRLYPSWLLVTWEGQPFMLYRELGEHKQAWVYEPLVELEGGTLDEVPVTEQTGETLSYPPVEGIPARAQDWDTYSLPDAGVTVPVPPGWEITEWPVDDTVPFSTSVSIWPRWDSAEIPPPGQPEISVTVWPLREGETLRGWLDAHSTAAPFGTDTGAANDIYFFGVQGVEETTMSGLSALGFTEDAMGIQVYNVIAEVDGRVVGLSKTHVGQFPLGPVFEMMRVHMQFGAD